ncbi:hypothetical protein OIE67_51075 [Nonomuraea fuscirosea]|uniref:hypothetical protein n=2 Tax=Nonomuraea fuscirosea TaxID=1291556 RepID=UPI002DDC89CC|nr:hypothetical protein [Nonomuraea fuscirosea]WSA52287.1 hypothetical protein OIE67_51075 [Nonomuraea fuscirosea]
MAEDKEPQAVSEDEALRDALLSKGYDSAAIANEGLTIAMRGPRSYLRTESSVPRSMFASLRDQLGWDHSDHPQYAGYIAPSPGVVEIGLVRGMGLPGFPLQISRILRNIETQCKHAMDNSWLPILQDGQIIQRIRDADDREARIAARIHLTRRDGSACIELSNCSPLVVPFIMRAQERPRFSIKLYLDNRQPKEDLLEQSDEILHSFLYELNSRNGVILSPIRWPMQTDVDPPRMRAARSAVGSARFPITSISPEIATLFGFATQATGNPTLAFLSYYQILEYFLFSMIRRAIIRDVRSELFDRKFDEKRDASVLKLIDIVEESLLGLEAKHLRTLLKEGVREELLKDFLENGSWNGHFSNKGPIRGVRALNAKDKTTGIIDQVAERVYKLRNRIVHAKDEPKYGDSKVLMPESREADSLGPDVQLIRFLAMEVIHESQGR